MGADVPNVTIDGFACEDVPIGVNNRPPPPAGASEPPEGIELGEFTGDSSPTPAPQHNWNDVVATIGLPIMS